jgi:hypothetical protein
MKNLCQIIFLLLIIGSGCNQNQKKNEAKEPSKIKAPADSASSKLEWMKLNNEWIPVITELDKILHSGKTAYIDKNYKESTRKINEAETLVNNKAMKNKDHKDLLSSSKALKEISEKIESGKTNAAELDSVIYKVCDIHMKNCWILKDRETDLWIPEAELQIHLDSTYYYLTKNDTLKSQEELAKANWIINADSKKYCSPEGKKTSDMIRKEMNSIKHALVKGEEATIGKIKFNIARTYFFKADNHYSEASRISFNYDNDRLEGDIELAREIKASVFYLQRAFSLQGIILSEKENFELENAELLGNELLGGYTHPKEEITESIKDIGRIMFRYRTKFHPEVI